MTADAACDPARRASSPQLRSRAVTAVVATIVTVGGGAGFVSVVAGERSQPTVDDLVDGVVVGPATAATSERPRADVGTDDPRLVVDDRLAATVTGDRVVARDAMTGEQRWATPIDDLVGGSITPTLHVSVGADDDAVVVTTPDHTLLLDRDDGAPRWASRSIGWQVWAAVLLDDRIVLRTRTGRGGSPLPRLEALDRATGAPVWDAVVAEVVDVAGDVIVTRRANGTVVGIDPRDGGVRWHVDDIDPALPLARRGAWITTATPDGTWLIAATSGRSPPTVSDLAGSTHPGGRWPQPEGVSR